MDRTVVDRLSELRNAAGLGREKRHLLRQVLGVSAKAPGVCERSSILRGSV